MLLPELQIPSLHKHTCETSGLDTFETCLNKEHFLNYPHKFIYKYNSRGFRDIEWVKDITKKTIFCFGDSFTAGLGCPLEHTWVYLLRQQINRPCINISMDGASNSYLSRKIIYTLENFAPSHIIVQWSYTHRRESSDETLDDKSRRLFDETKGNYEKDNEHLIDCITQVETIASQFGSSVIHTFIPFFSFVDSKKAKTFLKENNYKFVDFQQIDYARDYHHYDIQTSRQLVDNIINSNFLNM